MSLSTIGASFPSLSWTNLILLPRCCGYFCRILFSHFIKWLSWETPQMWELHLPTFFPRGYVAFLAGPRFRVLADVVGGGCLGGGWGGGGGGWGGGENPNTQPKTTQKTTNPKTTPPDHTTHGGGCGVFWGGGEPTHAAGFLCRFTHMPFDFSGQFGFPPFSV